MTKEEEIIKLREELDDTKHQLFRALRERGACTIVA
jgi:chorismate mutase